MGLGAMFESLMEAIPTIRRPKKLMQFQTVDLRVRMDCKGCERKVRKSLENMKGMTSSEVDRKQYRVTVTGYVDPNKVLRRVRRKTGKKAEFWPYKPYNLVSSPYAAGFYDEKAPAGYVRNADPTFPNPHRPEDKYISLFSDENPNACSVM